MSKPYQELKTYMDKAMAIKTAMTLFEWDNETLAPKEAGELTSQVIGVLSGEYFGAVTCDGMKKLLKECREQGGLTEAEAANVRELSEELEQTICIPQEEYQEFARLTARATSVWARAKKDQDFEAFAPTLEKVIGFQKKFAGYRAKDGKKTYDIMLDDYEKGFSMENLDEFFGLLKKELVPFLKKVMEEGKKIEDGFLKGDYPEEKQEELARLENLVERFKHKPNKASFARAKRKTMEHMGRVEKPQEDDAHIFTGEINPLLPGSKWVFTSEHLKIGYEKPLLEITMRIRRGQKIALLGPNGAGKTTFLKTIAGFLPSLEGSYSLGNQTTIGYFDQHSGAIQSEQTVLEHFTAQFPALTEKEARSILGAYLFGGRDAQKKVSSLSGGEKARLVLAELLQSRPNFLVLDEPTNHMDIQAKETLESAFRAYKGTILFVSHDRYLIRQVADAVMIFENQTVMYYPFGYEHYLERKARENQGGSMAAQIRAEEQALIAGMRAVPKAERHRLREIPEDEAYREWNMGLAAQHLEPAGNAVEYLTEQVRELRAMWHGSEEYWNGGAWDRMNEYEDRCLRLEQAWEEWHRACMEWLEKAQEMEVL